VVIVPDPPVEPEALNVQFSVEPLPLIVHGFGVKVKLATGATPASCDTVTSEEEPGLEIRTEPFRAPPGFGWTVNRATPLPVPGLPESSTMKVVGETTEAVHVQPFPVETLTSIVMPAAGTLGIDDGTLKEHTCWVTWMSIGVVSPDDEMRMVPTWRVLPLLFAGTLTEAWPVPVKGPGLMTVIKVGDGDAADHGAQSAGVSGGGAVTVTGTLNVWSAPVTLIDVGGAYVQGGAADWLIVTSNDPVAEEIRIVPLRAVAEGATLNVRVPVPVPGLPDPIVMNGCCGAAAVHWHPARMLTVTMNGPPLKVTGTVDGVAVGWQFGAAAWVTLTATPFIRTVPGLVDVVLGFALIANTAVPGPVPEPVVTEMNDADCESTAAFQLQPDGIETATLNGPALLGSVPDGPVSVRALQSGVAAAWVTFTATPLIRTVPGLVDVVLGFAVIANVAVPGPVPEPVVTEMNDADCESTAAFQLQPDGIETETLKEPALLGSVACGPVGVTLVQSGGAGVAVIDW
jgi:hypothetical protein